MDPVVLWFITVFLIMGLGIVIPIAIYRRRRIKCFMLKIASLTAVAIFIMAFPTFKLLFPEGIFYWGKRYGFWGLLGEAVVLGIGGFIGSIVYIWSIWSFGQSFDLPRKNTVFKTKNFWALLTAEMSLWDASCESETKVKDKPKIAKKEAGYKQWIWLDWLVCFPLLIGIILVLVLVWNFPASGSMIVAVIVVAIYITTLRKLWRSRFPNLYREWTCSACQASVPRDATACPKCGAHFEN
ncbi:hypothetical protein EDD75_1087 [Thermodesulfitimonas autotrophica]|uniref:Uncharacterized protein n=1 Tax=Thermodesulfitimonas autotrophica TaxID=1894989 RepID=A0A3N5BAX8_9THEO|nr:zinc ribbon domain-containing protein [Thermodesulfitimonas autotrophica]RPF46828.1 hypothetical protein EDD75_1087 [Thermodesulfitimonas autotrophica]